MNSSRYFVFKENLSCVCCGLQGTKIILEQHPSDKSPHFNLYGFENNKLVLMTKDHVQPKAYGGLDTHSNYQTMCAICNNLKGAINITLESLRELRTVYNENRHLPRKQFRKLIEETRQKLALPHQEKRISKTKRRYHLAKLKSNCKYVQTTMDIKVCRLKNGTLVGRSIYQNGYDFQIACIAEGTKLEVFGCQEDKVIIKFGEEDLSIYQGHLSIIEDEKCISNSKI
jgi:hypothetical protein